MDNLQQMIFLEKQRLTKQILSQGPSLTLDTNTFSKVSKELLTSALIANVKCFADQFDAGVLSGDGCFCDSSRLQS